MAEEAQGKEKGVPVDHVDEAHSGFVDEPFDTPEGKDEPRGPLDRLLRVE